jgi:hypothetical protein
VILEKGDQYMKRRAAIFFSGLILFFVLINLSCTEVQPQLKTVKLLGGEEVPDIKGYWKVDYEYYGILRPLSGYCNIVKIFQDENKFVAITRDSDQVVTRGTQIIKGELFRGGFKTVQLFTKDRGWLDCEGSISDDGNKIVLVEKTQTRTLTRKR